MCRAARLIVDCCHRQIAAFWLDSSCVLLTVRKMKKITRENESARARKKKCSQWTVRKSILHVWRLALTCDLTNTRAKLCFLREERFWESESDAHAHQSVSNFAKNYVFFTLKQKCIFRLCFHRLRALCLNAQKKGESKRNFWVLVRKRNKKNRNSELVIRIKFWLAH